jgi:hypothetical protein
MITQIRVISALARRGWKPKQIQSIMNYQFKIYDEEGNADLYKKGSHYIRLPVHELDGEEDIK